MGIFGWFSGKTAEAGIAAAKSDLLETTQKVAEALKATATQAVEERNEKLLTSINSLMELQRETLKRLEKLISRYVIPQEALEELTGELRAVRRLIDKEGVFRDLDRPRKKAHEADPDEPEDAGKSS